MEENEISTASSTPQMANSKNTPRRNIYQRIGTPLQRIRENDISEEEELKTKTPVTSVNPFEVKADSLYFPSCSPSVFATFARNKTDSVSILEYQVHIFKNVYNFVIVEQL